MQVVWCEFCIISRVGVKSFWTISGITGVSARSDQRGICQLYE